MANFTLYLKVYVLLFIPFNESILVYLQKIIFSMHQMRVEVWSDVVCPFCYIGKKNFEKALVQFEFAKEVVLEWKCFQLDPDFVQNIEDRYNIREELAHKYRRSLAETDVMLAQITATAESVGLHFDFERAVRFNTYNAHRILLKAQDEGIGNQMSEAFFSAYFEQGKDLGNRAELKEIALKNGLNEKDFDGALEDESFAYSVKQDIQEAANLGISGVPFFVFNRKYGVSGAQPPQVFLDSLKKAYKEWKGTADIKIEHLADGSSCDINGDCN